MSPGIQSLTKHRLLHSPVVLPLAFFLLSVVTIFSFWDNARESRIQNIQMETEITAEQVKLRLEAWVDNRVAILRHFASSWGVLSQYGEAAFINEALKIQALYPGFQAINLIDEEWVIRIVVPEATNLAALNKDLHNHPDPAVGAALEAALAANSIKRSSLIHLLQGGTGFATYYPVIRVDGSLVGTINGVFVMKDLVDSCLGEERLRQQFGFEVKTLDGEIAYSYRPEGFTEDLVDQMVLLPIRFVDKEWQLCMVSMAAIKQPLFMTGEGLLMIGGLLMALSLSLLMHAYLLRVSELRDSQSDYKLLVDNQVDMLIKVDNELRLTFVSPSAVKKLGIPEADLLGHKSIEFIHPDDLILLAEHHKKMATNNEADNLVLRMRKGEEWMWTNWTGSNILDDDGHILGRVSVGRDITQQREMENRLLQGQKLQAVGQLAGGVAHDFNNIIQAILGYLGFVKAGLTPGSEAFDDLTQAEIASERAATLTRQLLAFSRRQILKPVLLNLNPVTSELLPMLRRLLGESIELEFHPGSNLGTVRADRSQIEQILVNLCVNSRDAIETETGTIVISTSSVTLDAEFCLIHQWAEPGHWVCLSLSDSGCGMPESTMLQIFEPFFTTKETGKGTGLGLATVYGIIKQHDGLIEVSSQPEQGTRFSLYLKACDDKANEDEILALTTTKPGSETILLAEDEEMVRNLTLRILKDAGYEVLVADNGEQAYKLWNQRHSDIDLVVMDVVMPKMGGRELSQKIKQDQPDIRTLFISGYDSESFRTPLSTTDPVDLLLKPFNKESLLSRVREILDR